MIGLFIAQHTASSTDLHIQSINYLCKLITDHLLGNTHGWIDHLAILVSTCDWLYSADNCCTTVILFIFSQLETIAILSTIQYNCVYLNKSIKFYERFMKLSELNWTINYHLNTFFNIIRLKLFFSVILLLQKTMHHLI